MLTQALLRDAHAGTGGGDGHVVADGGGVVGGSGITYGATTSKAAATTTSTTTTSSTGSRAAAMAAAAAGWVPAAAHSASLVDSGGWSWVRNPKAGGAVPVRLQVTAEGLSWLPLSGAAGAAAAQVYDLPMSCIVGATVGGDAGAAGSGGATDASSASTAASAGRTTLTVVAFPHVVGRDGAAKPQRYRRVLTFTRIAAVDAERLADSAARHVGATLPAAAALGGVGASEAAAAEWAAVIGHLAVGSVPPVAAPATAHHRARYAAVPPRRRRLLVFINPTSGQGKGVESFRGVAAGSAAAPDAPFSCATMLADAGCDVEEVVTTRAAEATDKLAAMPAARLAGYDGVVGVGGDGILNEILHGVMWRPDWATVVDRVTIGLLPAGSGNGLVCSLLAAAGLAYSLHNACLLVAKNVTARLDVASTFLAGATPLTGGAAAAPAVVGAAKDAGGLPFAGASGTGGRVSPSVLLSPASSADGTAAAAAAAGAGAGSAPPAPAASPAAAPHHHHYAPVTMPEGAAPSTTGMAPGVWGSRHYTFLSVGWGIVPDLDIESETCRCLGHARYDVWGLVRAMCLRKYRGRLSYLPATPALRSGRRWSADAATTPLPDMPRAASSGRGGGGGGGGGAAGAAKAAAAAGLVTSVPSSGGDAMHTPAAGAAAAAVVTPPPRIHHLTPFDHPVPLQWRTIEGVFTLVWATNTTHQSIGVAGAPASAHDDGVMTLTVVRDVTPCTMTSILLGMDSTGTFAQQPAVEVFTCNAFRLEPDMSPTRPPYGHISLDGEDNDYGPVQAEVHPGLLRVYGPAVCVVANDVESASPPAS